MTTLTPEDLQRFCSDDESRPSICHPFSQEKWTYATDGRLMIRVPRLADVPEYDDAPKRVDATIFGKQPITGDWFKIPELPTEKTRCDQCGGGGECECGCGDIHKCGSCDGEGEYVRIIKVPCGTQNANNILLAKVAILPNVEICNSAQMKSDYGALGIRFDGGEGRLMPMKD